MIGNSDEQQSMSVKVPASLAGERLDSVATLLFDGYSRSRLQRWIVSGDLLVDGVQRRSRDRLAGGEWLTLSSAPTAPAGSWEETWSDGSVAVDAEALTLDIVHRDTAILVVNKPAGLVMHPAPGNRGGTLMNGLVHLDPSLRAVPRAGIVHRLDKDTTGLCVVAATLRAHAILVDQLQRREMRREYLAVVLGEPPARGTVDQPIARHPRDRKRMAVVAGGKPAITHYRVIERFAGCALLHVTLETGRTHQIRVHLCDAGYPLLGDPVYRRNGAGRRLPATVQGVAGDFGRQALHATRLSLIHPEQRQLCTFSRDPADDMQRLLTQLRATV